MSHDDPKPINLATGDQALLHAAMTGEGCVALTPDLLADMAAGLQARHADIAERYPALVEACPYETRLAVTAQVFQAIVDHATDGGTFRYLIYDRLGFEEDAYVPLYDAGGMTISNEFDLSEGPWQGPWHPIETAPKDRVVLLYGCELGRHIYGRGYWFQGVPGDGHGWITSSFFTAPKDDMRGSFTPTHWMPMLDPPKAVVVPADAQPTDGDAAEQAS